MDLLNGNIKSMQGHMDNVMKQIQTQQNEKSADDIAKTTAFRNVFLYAEDGPMVLDFLLTGLGYGRAIKTEEEKLGYNIAVNILDILDITSREYNKRIINSFK